MFHRLNSIPYSRGSSNSWSQLFIFSFSGEPTSFNYITTEIHLNHYKVSPCVFNYPLLLFDHPSVTGVLLEGSTWWSIKDLIPSQSVHQNSFQRNSSISSSCNPECISVYHIIGGGFTSFLIIWVHASWFTHCLEWGILNPSISSLELSWVIFHLKPSLRIVAIYGAYKGPKFFFILPVK